jgi:hypothetical protein
MYLKKCPARTFSVIMNLVKEEEEGGVYTSTGFSVEYGITLRARDTVGDLIDKLNRGLDEEWKEVTDASILSAVGVTKNGFEWRQSPETGNVHLYWISERTERAKGYLWQLALGANRDMGFVRNNGGEAFRLALDNEVSVEVKMKLRSGQTVLEKVTMTNCCCCGQPLAAGETPPPAPATPQGPIVKDNNQFLGDPYIIMWDREDVLIRASFVQQTQN